MTDLEKAARQALEALDRACNTAMVYSLKARIPECGEFAGIAQDLDWSITALRQALEQSDAGIPASEQPAQDGGACPTCGAWHDDQIIKQPAQQEPVVWMYQDKSTHAVSFQKHMRAFVDHGATYETPLYTRPQAREPLTDDEFNEIYGSAVTTHEAMLAVEAKLREKNA